MKILACSLAALVSVALSGAVFAGSQEDSRDHQATGTVVETDVGLFVIETAKKERVEFSLNGTGLKNPKVGEKVTVHYAITGRGWLLGRKIEKARQGQ
jgi:hypothetical protein